MQAAERGPQTLSWKHGWTAAAPSPTKTPASPSPTAGVAVSSDGITWQRGSGVVEGARGAQRALDVGKVLAPNGDWWWFDTCHLGVGDVQILSSNSVQSGEGVYWMFYSGGSFEQVALPAGLSQVRPLGPPPPRQLSWGGTGQGRCCRAKHGRIMGEHSVLLHSPVADECCRLYLPCLLFCLQSSMDGDGGEQEGLRLRPGLAMSQDGRNWARIESEHHTGALFDVGQPGEWDELFIGAPQVGGWVGLGWCLVSGVHAALLPACCMSGCCHQHCTNMQHSQLGSCRTIPPVAPRLQVIAAGPRDMRMYYHSFDRSRQRFVVGLATSPDGFRWTKKGPIFEVGGWADRQADGRLAGRQAGSRLTAGALTKFRSAFLTFSLPTPLSRSQPACRAAPPPTTLTPAALLGAAWFATLTPASSSCFMKRWRQTAPAASAWRCLPTASPAGSAAPRRC